MRKKYNYRPLSEKELRQKLLSKNKKLNRCIDGYPHSREARVGYCWNSTHPGYLTKTLLNRHNCIGKKCPYLQFEK